MVAVVPTLLTVMVPSVKSAVATSPVVRSVAVSWSEAPAELAGSTYQLDVIVPSGLATTVQGSLAGLTSGFPSVWVTWNWIGSPGTKPLALIWAVAPGA